LELSGQGSGRVIQPGELIALALESKSGQIAYTYSEPLVHAEYLLEAMTLARDAGLANILVSNGTARDEAAEAILSLCDAVNIDLKSFSPEHYAKTLGGDLAAVLAFIKKAHALGVHTELTTLVVTGLNDSLDELERIASFIAGISPSIPWHLSAYHPDYRWDAAPTDPKLLAGAARLGKKFLRYVYTGNIRGGDFSNTACLHCGKTLIARQGCRVDCSGLALQDGAGRCVFCGEAAEYLRM
jgi:pyruvate formate lyase activating enzyme